MKSGSRRAAREALVKLALLAISSGVALAGAELMLRGFADNLLYYRPHEMFIERWPRLPLVWRYQENVDYSGEGYGDLAAMSGEERFREKRRIVFKTDAFGFRNSEEIENHRAYDLIVLGDSFGVGNGITQDHTWVSLLQERYGLKVYNLSVPGSPWQHYVHLATQIDRLSVHPKSIVLLALFSGNDLDEYHYYDPAVELSDLPWSSPGESLRSRIDNLMRRSRLRRLTERFLHRNSSAEEVLVSDFLVGRKVLFYRPYLARKNRTEAMVRSHPNYKRLVDAIHEISLVADEHGLAVRVLLLPCKGEVYAWGLEGSLPWTTDTRPSGLAAAIGDFCRLNHLSFLDLKPSLVEASVEEFKQSGELLYWTDDTHWNRTGHAVVADLVYRRIFRALGRRPAPARP